MSQETLAAIGAGLGAVLVAALAYIAAVLQMHTRALADNQAKTDAVLRKAGTRVEGLAQAAAGAAAARTAPVWNQLQDPLPTGALPAWRFEECGEECVAEVIYAQHGVEVMADALRAQLGGPGRRGLTTGADLVRLLNRNNVPATALAPPDGAVAAQIQACTMAGGLVIVLGRWVSPTVLHWVLVTRADTNGCGANDPWGGVRRTWVWSEFEAAYAGEIVAVRRRPDA
jgi:hypothetical protein